MPGICITKKLTSQTFNLLYQILMFETFGLYTDWSILKLLCKYKHHHGMPYYIILKYLFGQNRYNFRNICSGQNRYIFDKISYISPNTPLSLFNFLNPLTILLE